MHEQETTTCGGCGAVFPLGTVSCPTCQINLAADPRPSQGFEWLLWIAVDLLPPWVGPLVTLLTATQRSDAAEMAGIIVWPGVLFAVGAYRISRSEDKMARRGIRGEHVRRYGRLARLSLLLLVLFEAAIVVVVSIYRWNSEERDIAAYLFKACLAGFCIYAAASALTRQARAKAVSGQKEEGNGARRT